MSKSIPLKKLYSTKKSLQLNPNEMKGEEPGRRPATSAPAKPAAQPAVHVRKQKVAGVANRASNPKNKKTPMLGGIQLQASVIVNQPAEICYRYWRDFENLPHFMEHIQLVEMIDDTHSHWVVDAPADTTVEWDAEIIEDLPGERISWQSVGDAQITNAGSVSFSPGARGQATIVKVALTYNPPLGAIGEAIIDLFGESPDETLADDLERFKETMESDGVENDELS